MSKQNFKSNTEALARARELLDENRPKDAAELLQKGGLSNSTLANAYGVCLMRCGELDKALEVYRNLCMSTSVCVKRDARAEQLANYATALLLKRNLSGCVRALREIRDPSHVAAVRLQDAIHQWKRSLSWTQRVRLRLWDHVPSQPIELGFPPGDLDGHVGP
jgi:hypothetical protein